MGKGAGLAGQWAMMAGGGGSAGEGQWAGSRMPHLGQNSGEQGGAGMASSPTMARLVGIRVRLASRRFA